MTTQNFKVMTNCKKLFKIQPTREKKKKKKKNPKLGLKSNRTE